MASAVNVYVNGHFWTRMSIEQFEMEYLDAAPVRRAIQEDFERHIQEVEYRLHVEDRLIASGWVKVIL